MSLRVLHLPTVDWQATEGIARACRELAAELHDYESYLVVDRDPGDTGAAFAGVRVIGGWTPRAPWRRAFADVVRELRPDVVHVHGGALAPVLGFAPALRDVPVVVTCYAPASGGTGAPRSVSSVVEHRTNVSPAREALAYTGGMAIARHALRSGRVKVLCTPDARVEAAFAGAGTVLRVSGAARIGTVVATWSPEPTIVFAGRAQTGRGVDDLLAAFPFVQRVFPSVRLKLMLLDGAAADRWRADSANARIEVSTDPHPDIASEFAQCQVGAFPFRWSTTLTPPLAAAEAMACGLPVVATPVACLAALVDHGTNGLLVPPEDPAALAGALIEVLGSEDAWRALSEGARKTIDRSWSWAGAAEAMRDAYGIACGRCS